MWTLRPFGYDLYFLFYNFILYSFLGWIYESCLVSVKNHTWVNRGFFNGPLIPLYGAAATLIYVCLTPVSDSAVLVFLGGMAVASALEFVTSYVMEKLFHAQWWDYSHFRFNIQGRVCLAASLFWGFLSIVMTELLQPVMTEVILSIPRPAGDIIAWIILALFLADLVTTIVETVELDKALSSMQRIREELMEYIESTRLYEAKEEWRLRFEQSPLSEALSGLKKALEEKMEGLSEWRESREGLDKAAGKGDIEDRVESYSERYLKYMERKNIIQRRLLKAFPNLKPANRESVLKDFKEKLLEKRGRKNK